MSLFNKENPRDFLFNLFCGLCRVNLMELINKSYIVNLISVNLSVCVLYSIFLLERDDKRKRKSFNASLMFILKHLIEGGNTVFVQSYCMD